MDILKQAGDVSYTGSDACLKDLVAAYGYAKQGKL
jgi:hypothetical protein